MVKRRIKFNLVLKDLTYDQLKKRMAQILKVKGTPSDKKVVFSNINLRKMD